MFNVKMEIDGEDINTVLERIGLFKVRGKNAFDSEKLREDANEFFKQNKLFGALALYNAALAFAPNDEVTLISLCYANRSAVYLHLEYFKLCLHNIDLAEKHYPREKIEKLNERRAKCIRTMKKSIDKARQPFNHTYQLSYAPNPKIPSVIDSVQLKKDETSGKYLITTKRELKAGDVIAGFDYLWTVPINDFSVDYLLACYNCLNVNNGDLIPGKCKALFCSKECVIEHEAKDPYHEDVHEIEKFYLKEDGKLSEKFRTDFVRFYRVFLKIYDVFGSVQGMKQFVDDHKTNSNNNWNYFDFDWSIDPDDPVYHKNMLLLIMSNNWMEADNYQAPKSDRSETWKREQIVRVMGEKVFNPNNRISRIYREGTTQDRDFIDQFVSIIFLGSHLDLVLTPAYCDENRLASYSHPVIHALHNSCDPNVFMTFENCKKFIWTVNQPISAGSQLFFAVDTFPYYKKLSKGCERSTCTPCQNEWSKMIKCDQVEMDADRKLSSFFRLNDPRQLINLLRFKDMCCEFINENFTGYGDNPNVRQKVAVVKDQLRSILISIANPFPNPFDTE